MTSDATSDAEGELVLAERRDDALILTLHRPAQRNPVDHSTVKQLLRQLIAADEDGEVRAVVVTGAGPAFSAGGDLRGYLSLYRDAVAFRTFLEDFASVNRLLETGRFVSVAMVNGACVAGGLELLLACDLSVAAIDARIGDGHARSGQLPGAGGSQRLWRAVGSVRAKELMLTGRLIDGAEAAAIGLVTRAVASADLRDETFALVEEIVAHSSLVTLRTKELAQIAVENPLDHGLDLEREIVVEYATTSHDATEGLHSFLDRRPPEWRDR